MRRLAPLAALLALSTSANSQAVDAAGAARLQDGLAAYVSKAAFEKGILKVTAEADGYRLALDVKPLIALFPEAKDIAVDAAPYALTLKPRADGMWDVAGPLLPDFSVKGEFEPGQPAIEIASLAVANGRWSGVYDPATANFVSSQGGFDSLTVKSGMPNDRSVTSYGKGEIATAGAANPNGGVDATAKQTFRDYQEQHEFDFGNGAPFPLTMKSPLTTVDSAAKGVRTKAMLDLVAFGVANPQPELAKAKQEELRGLLLAALPLWETMGGTQTMDGFSLASPAGTLNASKVDVTLNMDGVRTNGQLGLGIRMDEVKAASLFMPAWAPQFLPTHIDFNLRGDNINLDEPARKAIAAMDLNQDPPVPDAVGDEILAGFMASPPRVLIDKSTIRNALSEFTTQGELTYVMGKPRFAGTVEADGLDKTIEALQASAAKEPELQQAVLGAQMAKGMAKTLENGRLQWNIRAEPDGAVYINDTMVKPADPVTDDDDDGEAEEAAP